MVVSTVFSSAQHAHGTRHAVGQGIGLGERIVQGKRGPAHARRGVVVHHGFGAVLAVAGGAVVVGAAGFGIYELATRAILKDLLPEGTAIPATRGELALLLWQNAGRPEPAALPAFADTADAETAKAAQWCTEQGLLTAEDGAFHPEQKVTKYRVIRIWKQAAAPQQ